MGKLRAAGPSLSEILDEDSLIKLVDSLFPRGPDRGRMQDNPPIDWVDEMDVSIVEVLRYIKKRTIKNTAPGPDNIKSSAWKRVPGTLLIPMASMFTLCLSKGVFPGIWKRATLVLIPKGPGGISDVVKARPICLVDELGKTLERVIAFRINSWLEENEIFSLSENQFGFRRSRSTIDALLRVRQYTQPAIDNNEFAIAVSLDIANAFNSVPWQVILTALEEKQIPTYLRRIVSSYLSHRFVTYKNNRGRHVEREVSAGVPQGSVLGPLLWNVAFDSVLRLRREEGCHTVCYADDTLLISTSDSLFDAINKANIQIARVCRHIGKLGLTVAESKTEAMLFSKRKPYRMPRLRVGNVDIQVEDSMKYLGVIIDRSWNFRKHFSYIEGKSAKVTRSLSRLMPNLRGPGERKRQLYATIVTSVVMYAAPVWGRELSSSPDRVVRALRRLQRTVAIRIVAAYRTVSFDASTLLARMPPWTLEASFRCRVYERIQDLKRVGEYSQQAEREMRGEEITMLYRQWDILVGNPNSWGNYTTSAIKPHLKRWVNRVHGELNYFSTQILTGHGSFSHFLYRIGKKDSTNCMHCTYRNDTAEHTLIDCPAWTGHRDRMLAEIGIVPPERVTLSKVIEKILERREHWASFTNFAVVVINKKEEEERRLEAASQNS